MFMTRTQFFATFAAIPFIGKMFKPHVYPKYNAFGTLSGYLYYTFFDSPCYGETSSEPVRVQLGEPAIIKLQPDEDLQYLTGFKPGDRIFIEPGNGYPNGYYKINNQWAL